MFNTQATAPGASYYLGTYAPPILFAIALTAIMALQYRRSRDRGFIWLWVALVLWPLNRLILTFILQTGVRASVWQRLTYLNDYLGLAFTLYGYAGQLLTVIAVYKLYRNYTNHHATDTDDKGAGNP